MVLECNHSANQTIWGYDFPLSTLLGHNLNPVGANKQQNNNKGKLWMGMETNFPLHQTSLMFSYGDLILSYLSPSSSAASSLPHQPIISWYNKCCDAHK